MDLPRSIEMGGEIDGKVVVVLAHPDDESASAGGLLQRVADPHLIYLTDGAPRDLGDARRKGFGDWQGYAAHRKRELRSALDALGVDRTPLFLDCPDKEALEQLEALVGRLAAELEGADAVVSHAYEHGHPDHDTAALAVALARRRLGSNAPPAFEFAGYHLGSEGPVYGQFWGGGGTQLRLTPAELGRKRAAIAIYASQRETLELFPLQPERFRAAPDYDFARAAPPGRALYDLYGWAITSKAWRDAEPAR
jgi:N-acetylglucosamine malate deacetylase 2